VRVPQVGPSARVQASSAKVHLPASPRPGQGDQALDLNDTQHGAGETQSFVELLRLAVLDDIKAKAQAIVE